MSRSGGVSARITTAPARRARNARRSLSALERSAATFAASDAGREVGLALGLVALGALLRLGLLLLGWPATDSDEGTMGLMALHIATQGVQTAHPLFFYGQSYMGTIQAYLGALLFHLLGVSVFTLRLSLLLLDTLYLLAMYPLLRLLYGHRYALVGLLLLDLGGPDLLKPQLLALGGYPETLLFAALGLLLALGLARPHPPAPAPKGRGGVRRLAVYGALGLTLGLAWWDDQLIFAFLIPIALTLALFCRQELRAQRWRGLLALAGGLLVGVFPQALYLITRGTVTAGPSAVDALEWQGLSTLERLPALLGAQFAGVFIISLPDISGFGWVCAVPHTSLGVYAGVSSAGPLVCAGARLGWSAGLLALGIVAGLAAWRALGVFHPLWRSEGWSPDERGEVVRSWGRLALLLGGALTIALYLVSAASATAEQHTRYLIELNLALPAVAYPLWVGARDAVKGGFVGWFAAQRALWLRRAGLALVMMLLLGGVAATYRLSAATRASAQADRAFIAELERLGVRHMHTDYWTCDKVAFLSQERITCDTLTSKLTEGFNRYPPYIAQVAADPRAAWVFPASLPQAQAVAQRARDNPGWPYTLSVVDGYDIWLPK